MCDGVGREEIGHRTLYVLLIKLLVVHQNQSAPRVICLWAVKLAHLACIIEKMGWTARRIVVCMRIVRVHTQSPGISCSPGNSLKLYLQQPAGNLRIEVNGCG